MSMCLCKIDLHSRRRISTIVKYGRTRILHLNFTYIQANCPHSNNENVYIPWGCTPTKPLICEHQRLRRESLKTKWRDQKEVECEIHLRLWRSILTFLRI